MGVQATMNVICGERYKLLPDEIIQYALGLWGEEESSAIDPDVRDRILGSQRAKELAGWRPPQPSVDEVRRQHGGPGVSDDEMLLRYFAGAEEVDAMRAAGSVRPAIRTGNGLERLIEEASKHRNISYVRVSKGGMSVTLQGTAAAAR